ncbi:NAD(P)/FAD-dependent oxidoreductase [Halomonas sp. HNIBRBA4712]|uniref:NAD(P)/FAD-dependent oxidoreductase n=1 Tax=Halomonas sp. HNIBRBA4712 TaxID=3373087 RepID=UPI00374576B6
MDLKSGYPFWAVKNGLFLTFPRLEHDHRCDVAVIGGGITGALIADELAGHGHHVVVLERRDIGWGSSAASTALLQYEIDTHMVELAKRFDERRAVMAYQGCADAIIELERLAGELGEVSFERHESLYYASSEEDVAPLEAEFALREKHGFDMEWLDRDALKKAFGVDAPCAILSRLAASLDPYLMAYRLFERVQARGGEVFDRTEVATIEPGESGVVLELSNGSTLTAGKVVIAAGYESQRWLPTPVAKNRSSYAFVTDPIATEGLGKLRHTLVWESARPYLYMRATDQGRLLVGGDDDEVDEPARRDARVMEKAHGLARKVEALWPHLTINPTFSWAGTFAETDDGLPFFGPHPAWGPHVHFALAYGGNGITYSMMGAPLLRALIEERPHPLADFLSFTRLQSEPTDEPGSVSSRA